jgi:basic membrane protein A and related proteins
MGSRLTTMICTRIRPAGGRSTRGRATFVVALVLASAALVATACGSADSGTTADTGAATSVAFVSPQAPGDKGPIDDALTGLDQIRSSLRLTTRFVYVSNPSAYESTLADLARAHTGVIVGIFPPLRDAIAAVAPRFPGTKFVYLYAGAYQPQLGNVETVGYQTADAHYLAGILAAKVSASNLLGWVGGTVIPAANQDYHAFVAGARSVTPSIQVKGVFVGSFQDPVTARNDAASLYGAGADVIDAEAGGSSLGVVQVAQEKGKLAIYDSNIPAPAYRAAVIATTQIFYGRTMFQQVQAIGQGSWSAGAIMAGPKEGVIGLGLSTDFDGPASTGSLLRGAQPDLDRAKQGIIDGSVRVPADTSNI